MYRPQVSNTSQSPSVTNPSNCICMAPTRASQLILVRVYTVFWTETVLDGLEEEDDGVMIDDRTNTGGRLVTPLSCFPLDLSLGSCSLLLLSARTCECDWVTACAARWTHPGLHRSHGCRSVRSPSPAFTFPPQ